MNHMVASAADVPTGDAPVFVAETMRGYSAFFKDLDPREDNTSFIDPQTNKPYRAGYAMKDAVFRTNHGYDPTINKFRFVQELPEKDSSMFRYFIIKDSLNAYAPGQIGDLEALNITANVADKGGKNFYKCPQSKNDGNNIISAMFVPGDQKMYVAVEYGEGKTYKTACCGVYLNIDMTPWFKKNTSQLIF